MERIKLGEGRTDRRLFEQFTPSLKFRSDVARWAIEQGIGVGVEFVEHPPVRDIDGRLIRWRDIYLVFNSTADAMSFKLRWL